MNEYFDFESEIPWDKMELLLELGQEFSFDPSSSIESEMYFISLLSKYKDNVENMFVLLRKEVQKDFRVVDKKPIWTQDPEWQFSDGMPMEFIGQIEVKKDKINLHDDAIFYVFWNRETGETKTVIQIC